MMDETDIPTLPQYPKPQAVADRKQAGPMIKMISRMLKPKIKLKGKKATTSADIHIKHKKVRFW